MIKLIISAAIVSVVSYIAAKLWKKYRGKIGAKVEEVAKKEADIVEKKIEEEIDKRI